MANNTGETPLIVLGAYAAVGGLDSGQRDSMLDELAGREDVHALECAIDDGWPALSFDSRPERTDLVLTSIGATIRRLDGDPEYGLSSQRRSGRTAAIEHAKWVRDQVRRANDRGGRARVRAVEVHSAPPRGDQRDFADSLAELASWDWEGARLVVEHCDAPRPGPTAKGFLELADEIAAIRRADCGMGVVINWGRSAIEGRSALTPPEHARHAREAGMLAGLMFSGCSSAADQRGGPWADTHLPVVDPRDPHDPSLLDESAIRATLSAGGVTPFVGVKVSSGPDATVATRIAGIDRSVRTVLRVLDEVCVP